MLWPFAACERRCVTPFSVLLFHPMKWQSEEHVEIREAREWARHFGELEEQMDQLLADLFKILCIELQGFRMQGSAGLIDRLILTDRTLEIRQIEPAKRFFELANFPGPGPVVNQSPRLVSGFVAFLFVSVRLCSRFSAFFFSGI